MFQSADQPLTYCAPLSEFELPPVAHPRDRWSEQYVARCEQLLGPAVCRKLGIYRLPEDFLLSVVVPVYNEAATLRNIVHRLQQTGLPMEIILVDDGSQDGSGDEADALVSDCVRVLHHHQNRGKGAAIRTGFAAARGDVVVVQDADLEYDPEDFRQLLQPLIEGHADAVFGTRYGHCDRPISPWWHTKVNATITLLANLATGLSLSDVETCYKMVRRETLETVLDQLQEDRFGIEIELTARLAQRKTRFAERGIRYQHRWYDEGKKIGWKDGVAALWCIFRYGVLGRVK